MNKVKNKKAIRRLAFRELKADRRMNIVVVLSIMLTCILFTALTTIGGGMMNGMQQETMRQVGGNRMAGIKLVLPEDYEKVKHDAATKDLVYRIIIGNAVNTELKNVKAEFNCAGDDDAAKASFCYPSVGRLPESINETALSTVVLDELQLPHEIGTPVHISLDIDGVVTEHDLTLCGYWEGDKVAMAQMCWLSRAFADKYAPTPSESFYTREHCTYAGYWQVDFNYFNSWNITGKTGALLSRLYGDNTSEYPDTGINWAFSASDVEPGSIVGAIVILLVIFAAGYLIIYNIFHINISSNIRSYGLLKTIGTTAKQIRHMVRVRAAVYSAFGIPFGIVIGVLLSRLMMSSIVNILNIHSAESYSVSAELLVPMCLISAAFTFVTVMISCRKPCKIAGSVSPIEALRYNETDINIKKDRKKTNKVTTFSIALSNMSRSRKKTVVVVLSLTLSLVLVNTLFTVLKGIDKDKYIRDSIVGDAMIRHTDNTNLMDDRINGVTTEAIADLQQIEGAETHPIYFTYGGVCPEGEQLEQLKKLYEKYGSDEVLSAHLEGAVSGSYTADVYGIDEDTAAYFEPVEGSIDAEKLKSGKYAIVHTYLWNADGDSDVEIYHVGDTIKVECGDKMREYEVMAVSIIPYPLSTKVYSILETNVIVSAEEYLSLTDKPAATCAMISTSDESGRVKEQLKAYCDRQGSPLVYTDKQTYLDEFNDLLVMVKLVGGTLSGILALIGILNFINAVVTGILSRRRELAMMNAVGMTGGQLKKMLMWESVHYAVLTAVCAAAVGALLSRTAVRSATGDMFFFSYHFTLLPIMVCVPVLILLSAVIPSVAYRAICNESVVERLREN